MVADKADRAVVIAFLGLLKSRREFTSCQNLLDQKRGAALVIQTELWIQTWRVNTACPGELELEKLNDHEVSSVGRASTSET